MKENRKARGEFNLFHGNQGELRECTENLEKTREFFIVYSL